MEQTIAHLNQALEKIHCKRQFSDDVWRKSVLQFVDKDFEKISTCGYQMKSYEKRFLEDEEGFQSLYYMNQSFDRKTLQNVVSQIFADTSCGNVFRVKGFLQDDQNAWLEINATKDAISFSPIAAGQDVVIVIGEHLDEEKLHSYMNA